LHLTADLNLGYNVAPYNGNRRRPAKAGNRKRHQRLPRPDRASGSNVGGGCRQARKRHQSFALGSRQPAHCAFCPPPHSFVNAWVAVSERGLLLLHSTFSPPHLSFFSPALARRHRPAARRLRLGERPNRLAFRHFLLSASQQSFLSRLSSPGQQQSTAQSSSHRCEHPAAPPPVRRGRWPVPPRLDSAPAQRPAGHAPVPPFGSLTAPPAALNLPRERSAHARKRKTSSFLQATKGLVRPQLPGSVARGSTSADLAFPLLFSPTSRRLRFVLPGSRTLRALPLPREGLHLPGYAPKPWKVPAALPRGMRTGIVPLLSAYNASAGPGEVRSPRRRRRRLACA